MKKAQMALVAALCVAGFAQAAEWTWTSNPTGSGSTTEFPGVAAWDGSTGGVMTYAAIVDVKTSYETAVTLLQLDNSATGTASGAQGTHNNGVRVSINTSGQIELSYSNTSGETWANTLAVTSSALTAGKHAIGFAINNSETAVNGLAGKTLVLFIDGQQYTMSGDTSGHYWKSAFDTLTWDESVETLVALEDDVANASDITVTSIPEPTALALLALGVAGIALRRKVA